ncbi:MAG TPA: hypothetical protein VFZ61_05665 [Polyangiales bacterium]
MLTPPVRAGVCAFYCALAACSSGANKEPAPSQVAPKYSLDRPSEGLAQPAPRDASFRRGVSLDLYLAEVDEAQRAVYAGWLDQVSQLGATDLELVVQWSQLDAASLEIAPSATMTVDDEFFGWFMDQANQHQLRVVVTPVLELEQVAPNEPAPSRTLAPADSKRWFWNYHRFLLHYARIAEAHHAVGFAVGADLPDALLQDETWPSLIKDVRKAYKGKLTYAARWDAFESVPFWDNLDEVTVTGVGELLAAPAGAERDRRLAGLTQRLQAWNKDHGRPCLLSRTRVASSKAPAPTADVRGSLEQLDAMRRVYQAPLQPESGVAGVYLSLARPDGADRLGLPRVGSAAAGVVRHWYTRSRAPNTTAATLH